jgi:hypothetical protein
VNLLVSARLLAGLSGALLFGRAQGAETRELALSGCEEMGRILYGQPGIGPHLVSLFVTSRNPHAATDTAAEHTAWVNDPLHSYVADGTGGLVIWAHPATNDAARILACPGLVGIEISHMGDSSLRDRLWDEVLSACADTGRPFLWGFAADDTHSKKRIGLSWMDMRISDWSEKAIKQALRHGAFYTSTGPTIKAIVVAGKTIKLELDSEAEVRWLRSGQFGLDAPVIAPTPGAGHCLRRDEHAVVSEYALNEADGTTDPKSARFVRALIRDEKGGIGHTMPFRIRADGALDNPYPESGTWVRTMTHNHADALPRANPGDYYEYYAAYRSKGVPAAFCTEYGYWEVGFAGVYPPGRLPRIDRLEPAGAPALSEPAIVIHGAFFDEGVAVQLGTQSAREVRRLDAGTLSVQAPPLPPGSYDVVVTNPNGLRATLPGGFASQTNQLMGGTWRTFTRSAQELPSDQVFLVRALPSGVWVSTPQGCLCWNSKHWARPPLGLSGLPHKIVYDIAAGLGGEVWFATMDGLARLSPAGHWESWRVPLQRGIISTSPDICGPICVAGEGGVWVATRSHAGVLHFAGGKWERLTTLEGLRSDAVNDVGLDPQGRLWLADQRGLYRWENGKPGASLAPIQTNGFFGSCVTAMTVASNGCWWVASGNLTLGRGGVACLCPDGSKQLYSPANSPLPARIVWEIVPEADGSVWFATCAGVACRRRDGEWSVLTPVNSGLPSSVVYSIALANDGALWFATDRGVSQFVRPQR